MECVSSLTLMGGEKGGTGVGLDDNIRVAYGFIAHNYHKKDEIFLIGFSRGAYTVRSVCGLISTIGVLTKKGMNDFADIWKTYTSKEGFTPEYGPVYLLHPWRELKARELRIVLGVFKNFGAEAKKW